MPSGSRWLRAGLVAGVAFLLVSVPASAQTDISGTCQQPGNGVVIRGGKFE